MCVCVCVCVLTQVTVIVCACSLLLSLTKIQIIATAALFLAAKVEELPKKLEFVAKCSYNLLHKDAPALEVPSEVGKLVCL